MRSAAVATLCLAAVAAAPSAALAQRLAVRLDHSPTAPPPAVGRQGAVALTEFTGPLGLSPLYGFREYGGATMTGSLSIRGGTAIVAGEAVTPIVVEEPRPTPVMNISSEGTSGWPAFTRLEGTLGVYALPVLIGTGDAIRRAQLLVGTVVAGAGTTPGVPPISSLASTAICGFDPRYRLRVACNRETATGGRCLAVWTGSPLTPAGLMTNDCSAAAGASGVLARQVYGVTFRLEAGAAPAYDGRPVAIGSVTSAIESFDAQVVGMRGRTFLVAYVTATTDPAGGVSTLPAVATVVAPATTTNTEIRVVRPMASSPIVFQTIGRGVGRAPTRDGVALASGDGIGTTNRATLAYVEHTGTGAMIRLHTLKIGGLDEDPMTLNPAAPVEIATSSGMALGGSTAVSITDLDLRIEGRFGFLVGLVTSGMPQPFESHVANLVGWRLTRNAGPYAISTARRFVVAADSTEFESASAPILGGRFDSGNLWMLAYSSPEAESGATVMHAYARTTFVHGLPGELCSSETPCIPPDTRYRCIEGVCRELPEAGADAAVDATSEGGMTDVAGDAPPGDVLAPTDASDAAGASDATDASDAPLDTTPPTDAPATDAVAMDTNTMTDSARPDVPVGPPVDDGMSPSPNPHATFHGGSCSCAVAGRPLDARTNAGPVSLVAGLARTLRRRRSA